MSSLLNRFTVAGSVLLGCFGLAACGGAKHHSAPTSSSAVASATTPSSAGSATGPAPTTDSTTVSVPSSTVSTTPVTIPASSSAAATPPPSASAVVISYSGWDATDQQAQASAFVQSVVTDNGQCTLTLTQGTSVRTVSKAATPDVSTTQCGTMSIARAQLAPGTWNAVVTFSSASTSGTSAPFSIVVAS